jgi:hypothetical protein
MALGKNIVWGLLAANSLVAAGLAWKRRDLWREPDAKANAGEITAERRDRIFELVKGRADEIGSGQATSAEPEGVEDTVIPPGRGQWELAIEGIRAAADADQLCREVNAANRGGILDGRRHKALKQAARNKGTRSHAAAGAA